MIRTFTRKQLETKAKERPDGYIEDVLKLAEEIDPGVYAIDTADPEYKMLMQKYLPSDSSRLRNFGNQKKLVEARDRQYNYTVQQAQSKHIRVTVNYKTIYERREELLQVVDDPRLKGAIAAYHTGINKKDGCSGCTRNRLGRDMVNALATVYPELPADKQEAVRNVLGTGMESVEDKYLRQKQQLRRKIKTA